MALLAAGPLAEISAAIQRAWSRSAEVCAFKKTDLAAAVSAADSWADTNAASYNSALPTAFRTNATTLEKTLLLVYVIIRRANRDGASITLPG